MIEPRLAQAASDLRTAISEGMHRTKSSNLEHALKTLDLLASAESVEPYHGANPTPKPDQVVRYLTKLEEIARARQYAEQRSGDLFLR